MPIIVGFLSDTKFEVDSDNLTVGPKELVAVSKLSFWLLLSSLSLFDMELEAGTEFPSACTEDWLWYTSVFSCSLKKSTSPCSSTVDAGLSSKCSYNKTRLYEKLIILKILLNIILFFLFYDAVCKIHTY